MPMHLLQDSKVECGEKPGKNGKRWEERGEDRRGDEMC